MMGAVEESQVSAHPDIHHIICRTLSAAHVLLLDTLAFSVPQLCLFTWLTSHTGTSSLNPSPQSLCCRSAGTKVTGQHFSTQMRNFDFIAEQCGVLKIPQHAAGLTGHCGRWVMSKQLNQTQSSQEETEEGVRDRENKVLFSLREVWKLLFVV